MADHSGETFAVPGGERCRRVCTASISNGAGHVQL